MKIVATAWKIELNVIATIKTTLIVRKAMTIDKDFHLLTPEKRATANANMAPLAINGDGNIVRLGPALKLDPQIHGFP